MRKQGKITHWQDDKGFGFVECSAGGQRAFVHISAFAVKGRRPLEGEMISYQLSRDKRDRYQASQIRFVKDNKAIKQGTQDSPLSVIFCAIFIAVLIVSMALSAIPWIIGAWFLLLSVITFIIYALDKSAAQQGRWRTSEKTLQLCALFGGWPGALLAQRKLRHKSSKVSFKRMYWLMVLLNVIGLGWLHSVDGQQLLHSQLMPFIHSLL